MADPTPKQKHRLEVFKRDSVHGHATCAFAGLVPSPCRGSLQADHILRVQVIEQRRRELLRWLTKGLDLNPGQRRLTDTDEDALLADSRNGWVACELHHGAKDRKLLKVPPILIPDHFWDFIEDFDLHASAAREGLHRGD